MSVTAFSHVAIRVSDLDAALDHYRGVLGFRDRSRLVVTDTPSFREAGLDDAEMVAHFLHRDGLVIEPQAVRSRSGQEIPPHLSVLGYRHLGFRVDDVRTTAQALADAGGTADWSTMTVNDGVGGSAIFGADPDGLRIELLRLDGGPTAPVGDPLADPGPAGDAIVDRFDHVALGVRDLEIATRFYCGCLGGSVEELHADRVMVQMFAMQLLLERTTPDRPQTGIRALRFRGPEACRVRDPDGALSEVFALPPR